MTSMDHIFDLDPSAVYSAVESIVRGNGDFEIAQRQKGSSIYAVRNWNNFVPLVAFEAFIGTIFTVISLSWSVTALTFLVVTLLAIVVTALRSSEQKAHELQPWEDVR